MSKSPKGLVHVAAMNCFDSLKLLVKQNSKTRHQYLSQVNNYSQKVQPLHFAVVGRNIESVRFILENLKEPEAK